MTALEWREKMTEAPRLVYADGLVMAQLGEDSVLFPTEADARFFYAAYTDVPNLAGQNASLRALVEEEELNVALARCAALEAEAEAMRFAIAELQTLNASLAENAAKAVQRARILAHALAYAVKNTP